MKTCRHYVQKQGLGHPTQKLWPFTCTTGVLWACTNSQNWSRMSYISVADGKPVTNRAASLSPDFSVAKSDFKCRNQILSVACTFLLSVCFCWDLPPGSSLSGFRFGMAIFEMIENGSRLARKWCARAGLELNAVIGQLVFKHKHWLAVAQPTPQTRKRPTQKWLLRIWCAHVYTG